MSDVTGLIDRERLILFPLLIAADIQLQLESCVGLCGKVCHTTTEAIE